MVLEYEAASRKQAKTTGLAATDVDAIFDYLCLVGEHFEVHYLWRPFLRDPKDDMVLELAVASGAESIVTYSRQSSPSTPSTPARPQTPSAAPRPALVPAPPGSDAFFIPPPSQPEQNNRFQIGLGLSGNLLSLGGGLGLTTSGPYAGSQEVHGALFGFSGDLALSAKGNTEISIGAGFLSKYLSVGVVLDNPDVGSVRFRGINVHVGAGVGLPYTVSKELP